MSEILVVRTETLGAAYRLANEAFSKNKNVHEICPLDPGGFCLIEGVDLLDLVREKGSRDLQRVTHIRDFDSGHLRVYFGLGSEGTDSITAENPHHNSVTLVEGSFIGDLFSYVNTTLKQNPEYWLQDIRQIKGGSGTCSAIIRGAPPFSLQSTAILTVTIISKPHADLLEFF